MNRQHRQRAKVVGGVVYSAPKPKEIGDNMFRRSLLFWVLVAYTLIVCIMILVSSPAKADESSYINTLYDNGVPVDSSTLTLGHAICTLISEQGPVGVQKARDAGLSAHIPAYVVGTVIGAAVNELCPSNTPAVNAFLAHEKSAGRLS